ncbi:MAG: hypothetical protein JRF70_16720, partial [Deltaproteobacteria bacterium]|nr:hypothetical protein [Deltaproteobacteria bacterium]
PAAFKDAVSFSLVHKGLSDYMHALGGHLEAVQRELARQPSLPVKARLADPVLGAWDGS